MSLCTTIPTSKTYKFKGITTLLHAALQKDYISDDALSYFIDDLFGGYGLVMVIKSSKVIYSQT